jgi:hypothetical protein
MKISILNFFSLALLLVSANSCKNDLENSYSAPLKVSVDKSGINQTLSDLFMLDGFTCIESNKAKEIRGIEDVVFTEGKIFILDNLSDFQNIWSFNERGDFLGTIGQQSESMPEGYGGLNDFCLSSSGHEILGLDAGKLSFKHYDLSGTLLKNLPNGVYGENIEATADGGYIVYNEYGASDVSKHFHLLFFDKSGNLVKRLFPYNEELEGMAFNFSGFIGKSSNTVWFSPPFCDTIYSVSPKGIIPEYFFDFGQSAIPSQLREHKIDGWDVDNYAYITSTFIKMGKFSVFKYFADQRSVFGVFDSNTGNFMSFNDAKKDAYTELLKVGKLFQKDDNSLAFVLESKRIKYLSDRNLLDTPYFESNFPELLKAIKTVNNNNGGTLILYLKMKPEANITI